MVAQPQFASPFIWLAVLILLSSCISAKTLADLDDHLIGLWKFDEGTGTNAVNSAQVGYNGILVNMAPSNWVSGKYGGALNFNGTGGYVKIAQPAALITGQQFTVSAWVQMATNQQAQYPTIIADLSVCGVDEYAGFWFGWDQANAGLEGLIGPCSGSYIFPLDSVSLTQEWHLVTLTYDGATARIYHDGELVVQENGSFTPGLNGHLYIGWADDVSYNYHWRGKIDDVRIYSLALNSNNVATMYKSPVSNMYGVASHPFGILGVRFELGAESPYSERINGGVYYRNDTLWTFARFTNAPDYQDGWYTFYEEVPIQFNGICQDDNIEYFCVLTYDNDIIATDGNFDDPHTFTLDFSPIYPPSYFYSNPNTRSIAYIMNETVHQEFRFKILPADTNFGPWLAFSDVGEYNFLEVTNTAASYAIVAEILSVNGCIKSYTNTMTLTNEGEVFIPTEDFAQDIRDDLLSIIPTNAVSSDKNIFQSYAVSNSATWASNWTTNFDFTGVAWDSATSGTLISSQQMICVEHFQRSVGEEVTFHDKSGNVYIRTITNSVVGDDICDLVVYDLDSPLPSTIKHYKILPPTYRYIQSLTNALVVYTDQERKVLVGKVINAAGTLAFYQDANVPTILSENLVTGDSGHPTFLYIDGELVLLSIHCASNGAGGSGDFLSNPDEVSENADLLDQLSSGLEFEVKDMTGWGEYLP